MPEPAASGRAGAPTDESWRAVPPERRAESARAGAPAAALPEQADPARAAAPTADQWRAAVERIRRESSRHGTALAFGRLLWIRPGEVAVAFPPKAAFQKSTVTAQSGRALIEKILADHFGAPTRLLVEEGAELAAAAAPSLAEEEARSRAEHEKSTGAMARSHPSVRMALRVLGGEVEHIQVLDRPRADEPRPEGEEEPAEQGRPE